MTTGYEQVQAHDGGSFAAYRALPPGGAGPGILLYQEIFGINDNMRGLAEKVAAEGYVALVPDMFWRIEARFERKDESGLEDGIGMIQKFDWERGGADIASALGHLRAMPECNGRAGGVGFCFGGVLAYLFAATSRPDGKGPDAAVSYYGSGVHGMLNLADRIECPIMFHYGDQDPFIPGDQIDQVEAAVAGKPNVEFHRYAAGHAFSNWDAQSMYDQTAAEEAWSRTLDFFARHLKQG
jgi:carboxymethylenebutenolidase